MKMDFSGRIIIALDTGEKSIAKKWIEQLSPHVSFFKVGSELFTACGPSILDEIHKKNAKVFLDLKFHDIPQTVANSVRSACSLGVEMLNVHASGGLEMMRVAQEAATASKNKTILLAVTVLTSMNPKTLKEELNVQKPLEEQVTHLAQMAKRAGLAGVVCSAQEVKDVKKHCGQTFLTVTPGIRPAWAQTHDQVRIMTPKEAFQTSTDYIVLGRPVTGHEDPSKAIQMVLNEL